MSIVQIPDWKKDVFLEKTLGSVFRVSIGVVGSPFDFVISVGVATIGIIAGIFSTFCWEVTAPPNTIASIVQDWSVVSAGFAGAILGFLIAGFSIFATMTDKTLFHDLAKIKSDKRDISEFKFIFYNFLYIFIHYLAYMAVSMFVCFMFVSGSPLWFLWSIVNDADPYFAKFSTLCFAVAFGSYSLYAVLLLRSFIWSMYQSLLVAIFAEA